ncbi:MAG: site-2 protease family protein [Nanoarchaeota archaeon]|nr:site-2 protease family protein [Nanoarchaeota archaeon]
MDKIASQYPRFSKFIGILGIITGFGGMLFIFIFLIKETIGFLAVPGSQPPLAPVLPGISIPGAPALSFWHWILAIFFVAIVHEFAHGIQARVHNIKIKSSGIAFFGPILAAFVEPDEKQLEKKSRIKQLSVFAGGPFSNLVFGIIFLLIFVLVLGPISSSVFHPAGINVGSFIEGYPAESSGLEVPFTIETINGNSSLDFAGFTDLITKIKVGEAVSLGTDQGAKTIIAGVNPDNDSKGFIGITAFSQKKEIKSESMILKALARCLLWFNLLVFWLFVINIGVGLFNLLPLGIVDGGRMFLTVATAIFQKKTALRIFSIITWLCLTLIVINLLPWMIKLVLWICKGISFLISIL